MEGRRLLADARKSVEREQMCTWKTRHIHKSEKKKKGPVEPEKEEEEDKLERLFCNIYEFHNPVQNAAPVFVPAELPPRYAINFLPAASASTVDSGLFLLPLMVLFLILFLFLIRFLFLITRLFRLLMSLFLLIETTTCRTDSTGISQ